MPKLLQEKEKDIMLCKTCLGCNKLELPGFKYISYCKNYAPYERKAAVINNKQIKMERVMDSPFQFNNRN